MLLSDKFKDCSPKITKIKFKDNYPKNLKSCSVSFFLRKIEGGNEYPSEIVQSELAENRFVNK